MRTRQPHSWLLGPAILTLFVSIPRGTAAQDVAATERQLVRIEAEARNVTSQRLRREPIRSATYVEERLTDGELYYRLRDYVRASIIFTDIVENHRNHRAYPDALFLLGDSLYRAGDYLGARTKFRQLLTESSSNSGFRPHVQGALGRLIEIAIRTRDFEGVEDYFAQLDRLPSSDVAAATNYYRAKYLYSRAVPTDEILRQEVATTTAAAPAEAAAAPQIDVATLEQARQAFERVPQGSEYYPQARYFVGVIYTVRGQYPQGIDAFRNVLRSQLTSEEHKEVGELTQLALGRLYYETDQLDQAIEAYQAIPRTSSRFDVALYEIAWVYIRLGDSTRAERALEVLSVAMPESRFIPDAKVLRGNLLLRNGRFDESEQVFQEVRAQFGPVRTELEQIATQHEDLHAYFRGLVQANLETFDANAFLPPGAVQWVRAEEGDMDRALGVVSDLSQSRRLIRETTDLIERLNAALNTPSRVNVFSDLRHQRERTVAIRNQLTELRQSIIRAEARATPNVAGELADVRNQRRQIEQALGGIPTNEEDFAVRDDALLTRYRTLERDAGNIEVELLGMEARIVAMERFLEDSAEQGRTPANAESIRTELAQQRTGLTAYREQLKVLERTIEVGRLQVGVGDDRYARDDRLRQEYAQLVERERSLMAAAGIRQRPEVDRLFGRMASIEGALDRYDATIDAIVDERTAEMRRVIDEETTNVEGYRTSLAALDQETEDVVASVAHANFDRVRQRFYDLVLRADVGRVDIAWARREEHRMRVDMLTRERSREIQVLDDEFREIMDMNAGEEEEE